LAGDGLRLLFKVKGSLESPRSVGIPKSPVTQAFQ